MIDWLLNDILPWRDGPWERKRCFLWGQGYIAMPPPHLFGGYLLKNGGPTYSGVSSKFQEGFGHYTDQKTPFKRWKQTGKLWKSRFKWTGHWKAQSCLKERILKLFKDGIYHFPQREGPSECWQLINEAYISGLEVPEAFLWPILDKTGKQYARLTLSSFVMSNENV